MERHPLLNELLKLCTSYEIDPAKAYTTYEVYQELSEVRKLSDLKYFYSDELKLFYLSGKKETTDEYPCIFVPVMSNDEITLYEMSSMQKILSPDHRQVYLLIRDRDSTSTCYCITNGLVKPDSPETCKKKKAFEGMKYQFDKTIQNNRKIILTKALKTEKNIIKGSNAIPITFA